MESYFAGVSFSISPIKLKQGEAITDISKFIESHLATLKANCGNETFLPFLKRIQLLKYILQF